MAIEKNAQKNAIPTQIPAMLLTPEVSRRPSESKVYCRKSLYVDKMGGVRYVSEKTRSWTRAEALMRNRMDERDPDRIALRQIEEGVPVGRITVPAAIDRWPGELRQKSRSRTVQLHSLVPQEQSRAKRRGLLTSRGLARFRLLFDYDDLAASSTDPCTPFARGGRTTRGMINEIAMMIAIVRRPLV